MKIPKLYRKVVRGRARAAATFPDRITKKRREILFGDWGTNRAAPDAQRKYGLAVAKWIGNGQRLPGEPARLVRSGGPTVAQLAAAYLDATAGAVGERQSLAIRLSLTVLVEIAGDDPIGDFGPLRLKEVRDAMIVGDSLRRKAWSRTTVNGRISIILAALKWAAEHELIGPEAHARCATVKPLQPGRSLAAEPRRVLPVSAADVLATLPLLPPPVRAMVRLQWITGARPGEVCAMRLRDIDFKPACAPKDSRAWLYRPASHKTAWRGQHREIWLGPEAQDILRPHLSRPVHLPIFSPADAVADLFARRRAARVCPPGGNEPGTNRRPFRLRTIRDGYTVTAYARAIARAAQRADAIARESGGNGVDHWHPHQLRHSYATRMRAVVGIEATSTMLGHASVAMTEIYAERDHVRAANIAEKYG